MQSHRCIYTVQVGSNEDNSISKWLMIILLYWWYDMNYISIHTAHLNEASRNMLHEVNPLCCCSKAWWPESVTCEQASRCCHSDRVPPRHGESVEANAAVPARVAEAQAARHTMAAEDTYATSNTEQCPWTTEREKDKEPNKNKGSLRHFYCTQLRVEEAKEKRSWGKQALTARRDSGGAVWQCASSWGGMARCPASADRPLAQPRCLQTQQAFGHQCQF